MTQATQGRQITGWAQTYHDCAQCGAPTRRVTFAAADGRLTRRATCDGHAAATTMHDTEQQVGSPDEPVTLAEMRRAIGIEEPREITTTREMAAQREYEIVAATVGVNGPRVLAVVLPGDAFEEGMDDPRYPPPEGAEWGEGLVSDGIQYVEVVSQQCTYAGGCDKDPCPVCGCDTGSGRTCDGHCEGDGA